MSDDKDILHNQLDEKTLQISEIKNQMEIGKREVIIKLCISLTRVFDVSRFLPGFFSVQGSERSFFNTTKTIKIL